jgi:hypothetical protein
MAARFASQYGGAPQGRHPTFAPVQLNGQTAYRVRIGHLSN